MDGTREVAVYTTTEAGRDELTALFTSSLETVRALDPLPLHTALSMSRAVPPRRDRPAPRAAAARPGRAPRRTCAGKRALAASGIAPPHVVRVLDLQVSTAEVERAWVVGLLEDLRAGRLAFAGEPAGWEPAPDDPGWQMHHDRERYRALLAGR